MPRIMIMCPNRSVPVHTGIDASHGHWDSMFASEYHLGNCPSCGEGHPWSRRNAWVEDGGMQYTPEELGRAP